MELKLVNRGDVGEVLLIGRLDASTAPAADKILSTLPERFNEIILNLSQMDYTASAGLRVILKLQKAMEHKGGSLKIKGAKKMVLEVFEMTGFASFLDFID